MSLPTVGLDGSPYRQGMQHGEVLKADIASNLAVYFHRFEAETQLPRAEVLRRARLYRSAIGDVCAAYADGMRGIADGSGFSEDEIAALNVRYELMYCQFGEMAMERDGCTSFAAVGEVTDSGHTLMGQNWDWIPQVRCAILHTREPGVPPTLSFTEAGIFGGKIGLSATGLGLCINGMTTTEDDWSALHPPFHVKCYAALRSETLESAVFAITAGIRPCASNFMLAMDGRAVDVEAAPHSARTLHPEDGRLVHTNHFLDPEALGVTEPPIERREHSRARLARFRRLLDAMQPVTIDGLQVALQDHERHPFSVCRHEDWTEPPSEHYITVASIIMDLTDRTLFVSDGPPCGSGYDIVRCGQNGPEPA